MNCNSESKMKLMIFIFILCKREICLIYNPSLKLGRCQYHMSRVGCDTFV